MSSPLSNTDSQCTPSPRVHSKVFVCRWDECPETFIILSDLVSHLHEDHVGRKKANYTCEWASCPRKGATQTSRFALITHLRSHTGEKPYDCKEPGCEKSFTRPDSLTKHMKSQHSEPRKKRSNMEEPQRTHKKRKVTTSPEEDDDDDSQASLTPIHSSSHNHNNNYNNTNHNNNHNNNNHNSSSRQALRHSIERQRQLHQQRNPSSENAINPNRNYTSNDDSSLSEPSDDSSSDAHDGNNNGNNNNNNNNSNNNNNDESQKSFYEKYLVLKAKHRYIKRENELLTDEYQVIKRKLKRLRTEKDILLDAVMQQSGMDDDDGDGDADI